MKKLLALMIFLILKPLSIKLLLQIKILNVSKITRPKYFYHFTPISLEKIYIAIKIFKSRTKQNLKFCCKILKFLLQNFFQAKFCCKLCKKKFITKF